MFELYRLIWTDFLLGQQLAAIKGERKRCSGCRKVLNRHRIFNTTKSFCTVLVLSSICLFEKASGKTQELGDAKGIIIMYFKNVLVFESKNKILVITIRYETKTERGTTKGRFQLNTCNERQNCACYKFSQAALSFIIS